MDDTLLGQSVRQRAEAVDGQPEPDDLSARDHVDASRYFFLSSAVPMIAGTMGPIASAFSVCALVRPWRQHVPSGSTVQEADFVDDPIWLLIINAVQLAIALAANLFLLLNMAKRVRFTIAQPVTIIGWYISSFTLVTLLATASGPLLADLEHPVDEYVWSQAFYYAVWAAVLYSVTSTLMLGTFWGAHTGRYHKDFDLTNSQRTLMLQTILLLFYLLLGAVVFSRIERWAYLDTVYWALITIFTVGFGDFACRTIAGRVLLLPYSLVGIITLGLVIGSIRSLVIERGKRNIRARVVEKARRRHLRRMARSGRDGVLAPIENDVGSGRSEGEKANGNGCRNENHGDGDGDSRLTGTAKREFDRRRDEFRLMRSIQHEARRRRRWMAFGMSAGTWLAIWLIGAKVFQEAELPYQRWTFWDGIYFTFVTLTTIGYGDRTLKSPCGRSFFVFWALLALPTTTVLISNAGDTVVKFVRDATIQGGKLTILPGEHSWKHDARKILKRLSLGRLYANTVDSPSPSRPGSISRTSDDDSQDTEKTQRDSDSSDVMAVTPNSRHADSGPSEKAGTANLPTPRSFFDRGRSPAKFDCARDPEAPLPTGPELHYILIHEIDTVTGHLTAETRRQYTFDEWAWYLKLLGEDEASADTHLKTRTRKHEPGGALLRSGPRHVRRHHAHVQPPIGPTTKKNGARRSSGSPSRPRARSLRRSMPPATPTEDEDAKWSWVGKMSPLMRSSDESDWILCRLTARLKRELEQARRVQQRRQQQQPSRGTGEDRESDCESG